MGANNRTAQMRRQKQAEAKRHRVRVPRPDLNSLVAPRDPAEVDAQRGTDRWAGRGAERTWSYAMLLARHRRFDEALTLTEAALKRYPRHARLMDAQQDIRLLRGDLDPSVWVGRYASRRQCPFQQPRWTGEPIPGSSILLWEEDNPKTWFGLGDAVMFVRLAAIVKARSQARVIAGVPRGMTRLFSSLPGVDEIVEPPWPTDGFDCQAQWTAIPALPSCELTAEWLAASVPYLFAETEAVERWSSTFTDRSVVHVGLHWRADRAHQDPKQLRSIPLSALAPVLTLPGAKFYSLQYNGGDEIKDFPMVIDLGNIDDPASRFVQTAGVMKHLDLLIACDSGPAHVAGALGTKVWMFLSLAAQDARWGLKQYTPWYPGHTLIKQSPSRDLSDWDEAVWEVREALQRFISDHRERMWQDRLAGRRP